MAEQLGNEGSTGTCSDSSLKLNIKTLDSRIFHFEVERNMPVTAFKEKIAQEIGVSVGQQRLIFRGKVLKDDHLLSEYHVENGDTLHLVERQPVQSQSSSGSGSGVTSGSDNNRGNDASAGAPRNRIGQISHSVVYGTFVGDQGEGSVPDLSRVIGNVLNSIALGGLASANGSGTVQPPVSLNILSQGPRGNESEGAHSSSGGQSQAGSQTSSGQTSLPQSFQTLPQVVQIPLAAATIPVPSLHAPIPHSLNTLSEFMSRMEQALTQNGYQPNSSSTNAGELPSNIQGPPTPEALISILHQARGLLSNHVVASLSHIAGQLEHDGASLDPAVRGHVQSEASQIGIAMQHLGALFLEIGRTMLTLRMGLSPGESFVNAGPAVYISPSGPNPIMVQPFPLQTNSLFGGAVPPSNPVALGPVGVGNPPRNINIHIHAGTALAPVVTTLGNRATTENTQEQRADANVSSDSAGRHARNVVAASIPSRPSVVAASTTLPNLVNSSSPPLSVAIPLSNILHEVSSHIGNLVGNMQEGDQTPSGGMGSTVDNLPSGSSSNTIEPGSGTIDRDAEPGMSSTSNGTEGEKKLHESEHQMGFKTSDSNASGLSSEGPCDFQTTNGAPVKSGDASSSGSKDDASDSIATAVPLGLGLGSLERKRRGGPSRSQTTPNENQVNRTNGQQVLQSLLSRSLNTSRDTSGQPAGQLPSASGRRPEPAVGGTGSNSQLDVAGAMSQVLRSPALNSLLTGVSEQTGVGSPDVLINMLQQLTESPEMMNTVSQIAQQVDQQDLGNIFGGTAGQGGGLDLSRMFQTMMPIVSQALSGGARPNQVLSDPVPEFQRGTRNGSRQTDGMIQDDLNQVDLQHAIRSIESSNQPEGVFQSMVQSAARLYRSESGSRDIMDALGLDDELAREYVEMLQQDIHRRLEDESAPKK